MSSHHPERERGATRREFLKAGVAATLAVGAVQRPSGAEGALPALPMNPRTARAMPTRNLGKTGYRVGIFSFGGQSALERPNNEAIAVPLVERALDLGVNYFDTSSIYGGPDRWSERYIGQVTKRRAARSFSRARRRNVPATDRSG